MSLPTLLALTGTALMAVAIFAPYRLPPPTHIVPENVSSPEVAQGAVLAVSPIVIGPVSPEWPALVEPTAQYCDAAARLDLVDGLRAIDSPWARAILLRALEDEPDAAVRSAVTRALAT